MNTVITAGIVGGLGLLLLGNLGNETANPNEQDSLLNRLDNIDRLLRELYPGETEEEYQNRLRSLEEDYQRSVRIALASGVAIPLAGMFIESVLERRVDNRRLELAEQERIDSEARRQRQLESAQRESGLQNPEQERRRQTNTRNQQTALTSTDPEFRNRLRAVQNFTRAGLDIVTDRVERVMENVRRPLNQRRAEFRPRFETLAQRQNRLIELNHARRVAERQRLERERRREALRAGVNFPGIGGLPTLGIALSRIMFHQTFHRHVPEGIERLELTPEEQAEVNRIAGETLALETEKAKILAEIARLNAIANNELEIAQNLQFKFSCCQLCNAIFRNDDWESTRCPAGGIGGPPFEGAPHIPINNIVFALVKNRGNFNECRICNCVVPDIQQIGRCALRPGAINGNFLVGSFHQLANRQWYGFNTPNDIPQSIRSDTDFGTQSFRQCSKCACYCTGVADCFDGEQHVFLNDSRITYALTCRV